MTHLTRPLMLLCLALTLAACSSNKDATAIYSQILPFSRNAPPLNETFRTNAESGAPAFIANIEKRPGQIGLFVLQSRTKTDNVSTWIAGDGAQVMLNDGLLVGTRGLGGDVLAAQTTESAALIHALKPGYATRLMTLIDGEDHAVTRAFKCKITPGDSAPVILEKSPVPTRTVTEECKADGIHFYNFYWVVPTSREIIQSSQWAGQFTDKISMRKAINTPR